MIVQLKAFHCIFRMLWCLFKDLSSFKTVTNDFNEKINNDLIQT